MASSVESLKRLRFSGIEFLVDGFLFQRPDVQHYVLTHFHSDHTVGLNKSFSNGIIYCSDDTAQMVNELMNIDHDRVCPVAIGGTIEVGGVRLTFLDAGHCPGSAIIVFEEGETGRLVVHTGDFRASSEVREVLCNWLGARKVTELYLDTTYCSPRWDFPDQSVACDWLHKLALQELKREPDTLFIIGSYQIGKERAALAAAEAAGCSVYIDHRRWQTIKLGGWEAKTLSSGEPLWSIDKADCRVWMVPLGGLGHDVLLHHLDNSKGRFQSVVGIRPTGWTYTKAMRERGFDAIKLWPDNDGKTRIYGLPYSEHSSFTELMSFVKAVRPGKVVPTVNAENRAARERTMAPFLGMLDLRDDRERMDHYLKGGGLEKVQDDDRDGLVDILALSTRERQHDHSLASGPGRPLVSPQRAFSGRLRSRSPATSSTSPASSCKAVLDISGDSEVEMSMSGCIGRRQEVTESLQVECAKQSSTDETAEKDLVDIAQQRRLLRYYEALQQEKEAATQALQKKAKPNKVKQRAQGGKGTTSKLKGATCVSRGIDSLLGVKKEEEVLAANKRSKKQTKGARNDGMQPRAGGKRRRTGQQSQGAAGTSSDPALTQGERRGTRFIPQPSARVRERISRAFEHRLYMLGHQVQEDGAPSLAWVDVLGSTGNVYRVAFGARGNVECQCPDFAKTTGVCKHILFVGLRVLKLSRDDHRIWQTSLTPSELQPLLAHLAKLGLPRNGDDDDSPSASQEVLRAYHHSCGATKSAPQRPLPADCPICFEEIHQSKDNVVEACRRCGHYIHTDCRKRWATCSKKGETCPLCRCAWVAPSVGKTVGPGGAGSVVNLATYSSEAVPSLEELYPDTHRWITARG